MKVHTERDADPAFGFQPNGGGSYAMDVVKQLSEEN